MSKLYFALFVIVAVYLIYKIKTKKPKQLNENRYSPNRGLEGDFSIANMLLFAELMNERPLPPIKRYGSHADNTQNFSPQKRRLAAKRKQLTKKQKSTLFRKYDHSCAICRVYLGNQLWNCIWDHIIPLAAAKFDDYSSEYLNRPDNFRPLCSKCSAFVTHEQRKQGLFRKM